LPPHALRFEPTQLDLLFMVDNSIGMAEKQSQLAHAIPALMAQLTTDDMTMLGAQPVVHVSSDPARAIVEHAKATHVDLIVVGTHGRGAVARLMMGSVAEKVVRTAPCPVLVVRPHEHEFIVPDAVGAHARI